MAVFRIERTRDYTVMANHHLRNKALSLKAKGLLSLMLSLPEDWDYTTRGLSCICKDGVDSIRVGIASPMPSFHPADMCIGICIAAAMRLAVYIKGKNAKKFRHNREYGSARWSA